MPNYYTELPEGYVEVYCIDAKKKKTALLFNGVATLMFFGMAAIIYFLKGFDIVKIIEEEVRPNIGAYLIAVLVFIVSMILYIILHELTHGLFYKIFTHQKLTFGLTLTVAYCGVPNLYCNKKTMIFSILAPFVIWSAVMLPFIIIFPANMYILLLSILFCVHFCGCVGDLYGFFVMLVYPSNLLVNDTGPKQTFYINKI